MRYKALDLNAACEALCSGRVIAFPTETFYGLGCDALNPDAVGAVYAMKLRPYGLPLPVIIGEMAQLERVAAWVSPLARDLMDWFWPGPLSIIFQASDEVPDLLTAGTGRVAVRFSPHPGSIALCRAANRVITASSANISGTPPVADPGDLDPELLKSIDGVYDAPPYPAGGKPSTIVDSVLSGSRESLRILRDGAIGIEAIRAAGFNVLGSAPEE